MKRFWRSVHRDQEGASAVLVVLSLFVLLGAAALAVDAGSLWMTKRNFVADTDAAALAAAMSASKESSCVDAATAAESEALSYLGYNQGGSVAGTPSVATSCGDDTVTVDFTGQAPMTFAGIFGFSQLDVFSSSTAEFDLDPFSLLRPLATCVENPIVQNAGEGAAAEIVTFSGTSKDGDLTSCVTPSGNWGWLCFAENCGASDDQVCDEPTGTGGFLRCGVDPGLDLGTAPILLPPPYVGPYLLDDEICYTGGTTDDWCVTKPGSKSALQGGGEGNWPVDAALEQRVFPILLIDQYVPDRGGRTEAHPKALLWVRMDGYCVNTSPKGSRTWPDVRPWPDASTWCNGQSFAFKMAPLHVQWSVDEDLPDFILQHVPVNVSLCGVDHDPAGGNRC